MSVNIQIDNFLKILCISFLWNRLFTIIFFLFSHERAQLTKYSVNFYDVLTLIGLANLEEWRLTLQYFVMDLAWIRIRAVTSSTKISEINAIQCLTT